VTSRTGLQPSHEQAAFGEQGGDLGDIGERWVRLAQIAPEVVGEVAVYCTDCEVEDAE
jgi:hypothetical protein